MLVIFYVKSGLRLCNILRVLNCFDFRLEHMHSVVYIAHQEQYRRSREIVNGEPSGLDARIKLEGQAPSTLTPIPCDRCDVVTDPVPDWVKPSFVIFDIRALWRSGLSARVPGCQKLQMTVWHRMLYICTYMATVVVKGLTEQARRPTASSSDVHVGLSGSGKHADIVRLSLVYYSTLHCIKI